MKNKDLLKQFAKGNVQILKQGGNAVIYNRVSSKDQLEGQSLEVQLEKCEQWAEAHHYTVLKTFGGTYESASSDEERKKFKEMLAFVKKNRANLDAVIVYHTSRFSRTGSTTIIEELEKMNITLFSATSSYDARYPEGKLAQGMELMFARYDNAAKSRMVKDNGRKALLKGRWIHAAPRGFDMKTTRTQQTIKVNAEGKLIRKAFLMKAEQNLTNEEVRVKMQALGLDLSKQRWTDIFRNPFYCGYFSHPYLQGEVIRGQQEQLVSEKIFLKVNDLLSQNHNGYEHRTDKEYAPLLGTLKCPVCGKNLTASESTRMRKKYNRHVGYYVCGHKGCKCNNAVKKVHAAFGNLLEGYALEGELEELLKLQLRKTFSVLNKRNKEDAACLRSNISKKQSEIEQVEMNYALATDPRKQAICEKALAKLSDEKQKMEVEMAQMEKEILNLDHYMDFALKMRSNLLKLWDLSNVGNKRRLQNLIFPEGICYDKKSDDIEPLAVNCFFAISPCKTDDCKQKENGQNAFFYDLSALAPQAGLEPATP